MRFFSRQPLTKSSPGRISPDQDTESRTIAIGRDILHSMKQVRGPSAGWMKRLTEWATQDVNFKVQMFRFIDVFPTLHDPKAIYDVLSDYMNEPGVETPPGFGIGMTAGGFAKATMAKTISHQIRGVANNFIAGQDAQSCLPKLRQLWDSGMAFSVDLLGEACVSDAEATDYRTRYLELVESLPNAVCDWTPNAVLERDHLGPIPRANISIKISSLSGQIKARDFDGSVERLLESLRPILVAARDRDVFVNFDMEQFALKELTIALFQRCCEELDFEAGIALQAYLRSGVEDARSLIKWAKSIGRQVTVRLIKGAYWDYEAIHADRMGWPCPVWSRKTETDACFERMSEILLRQTPRTQTAGGVKLALGTHNVRSIAKAKSLAEVFDLPSSAIEFQFLEGMADELKLSLVAGGDRVRSYVPIGQLIPGMAYLVRRLLENTSNESWLLESKTDASDDDLLRPPDIASNSAVQSSDGLASSATRHALSYCDWSFADGLPFVNEPLRDFSDPPARLRFQQAIEENDLPEVDGLASESDATKSIAIARSGFDEWSSMSVRSRAEMLCSAAEWMRSRRDNLAGIVIRESGKNWSEADADVCEAIDFCEFYAREALPLFDAQRLGRFAGELNHLTHRPVGVAAIISPWNFPLAICTGMTVAALVTGNSVIVKPSRHSPVCAKKMCEALWSAGVPKNVVQFLPGSGSTVGQLLIDHPDVDLIGFTGSRQVGFRILESAGQMRTGQRHPKRVVCEMGGKNAIIVDETADLDEAVLGVRHSAFGYAGQKCSACSRVIVVGKVYDRFLSRLVEATRMLKIGNPLDAATDVGPVIDDDAAQSIRSYIDRGNRDNCLELSIEPERLRDSLTNKPFVGPHIFSGVERHHAIAREEIFGPVLAVMCASSFPEAVEIANDSEYKLTGAVYSRTPSHLALARQQFAVGNLYLNSPSTGALVGRQPFGGFGHSGTGTKAGGRDYLKHFVFSNVICENAMRRGFSPELIS